MLANYSSNAQLTGGEVWISVIPLPQLLAPAAIQVKIPWQNTMYVSFHNVILVE